MANSYAEALAEYQKANEQLKAAWPIIQKMKGDEYKEGLKSYQARKAEIKLWWEDIKSTYWTGEGGDDGGARKVLRSWEIPFVEKEIERNRQKPIDNRYHWSVQHLGAMQQSGKRQELTDPRPMDLPTTRLDKLKEHIADESEEPSKEDLEALALQQLEYADGFPDDEDTTEEDADE